VSAEWLRPESNALWRKNQAVIPHRAGMTARLSGA
jgi:hypothetical protein